jgi:hypothetical protein
MLSSVGTWFRPVVGISVFRKGERGLVAMTKPSGNYFKSFGGSSLSEGYMKLNLSVILELGLKGNRSSVKLTAGEDDIAAINRPVFILQFDPGNSGNGDRWNEESMFVVDVESVERQNIAVPSLVTLHMIDKEIEDSGSGVYASCFGKRRFKPAFGLIGVDGKFCKTSAGRSLGSYDLSPRDIKSGAEIVDCISGNYREFAGQHVVPQVVVKELFPRLSVHVQAGAVTVGRGEESLAEILDVLIGPFDF